MAQQFKNNARSFLVASINSSVTSFVVGTPEADLFPVANVGAGALPSASNWFKATLQDSSGAVEIVAVRTRAAGSGVLSNVIRGYDGTTALAFVAGTVVGLRITAADVQGALDLPAQASTFTAQNTFSGDNTFTGTNYFGGVSSFTGSVTGQGLINLLYPVGSIYTNATNSTNPGTLFGVGTWTAFGAGRVPVGFNAGNALFDTAEETGGAADATLPSHTHTATSVVADPGHLHGGVPRSSGDVGSQGSSYREGSAGGGYINTATAVTGVTVATTNASAGTSGTNANYQPYITVYMWKRTA